MSENGRTKQQRQGGYLVAATLLLFAVLFALLSVVNHVCFRTSGLDLGIYTQMLYRYAHLQWPDSSMFLAEPQNMMGDHFDLYLILFSPLVYLFGTYTLLIVQIVAVLFGAWGIYRLIDSYSGNRLMPYVAMLCFLCFFGVWHALSFDYHSNVVAAMLVPWLLLTFRQQRYGWSMALVVLVSVAKETEPLFLFFIALALLWDYRKDRTARRWLLVWMAYSVIYFVVVAMVVMPALGDNSHVVWRYRYMGESFGEMAQYILTHPLQCIANFFVNFTDDAGMDGVKGEFYCCMLLSGLLLTCFKPNYLLMLLPSLAMKMLSSDAVSFWGISFQYNIEFAPVLVAASFIVIASWRQPKGWFKKFSLQPLQNTVAIVLLCCTIGTTFYTVHHPKAYVRHKTLRLYDHNHYRQDEFDADYARHLLSLIPEDASVCATTPFVPHLALRDSVYICPNGFRYYPQYLLVKPQYWCYYAGEAEEIARRMADTVTWSVVETNGDLYLLKRNPGQ